VVLVILNTKETDFVQVATIKKEHKIQKERNNSKKLEKDGTRKIMSIFRKKTGKRKKYILQKK
jgi:hypothetical protein